MAAQPRYLKGIFFSPSFQQQVKRSEKENKTKNERRATLIAAQPTLMEKTARYSVASHLPVHVSKERCELVGAERCKLLSAEKLAALLVTHNAQQTISTATFFFLEGGNFVTTCIGESPQGGIHEVKLLNFSPLHVFLPKEWLSRPLDGSSST